MELNELQVLRAVAAERSFSRAAARLHRTQPAVSQAERRQLTVMFCDLVGSVALAEQMAVEDYRDLLTGFRNAVVSQIEAAHGFVAKHLGDGMLAYFG